jgi:hypothetical protein
MKRELSLLFSVLLLSGCTCAGTSPPESSLTPPGTRSETYRNFNNLPPIVMPPLNVHTPEPAMGHMP